MGVPSSAGLDRPEAGRRTIRFTFITIVAIPAICLVLLWGLALTVALRNDLASGGFSAHHHHELFELELLAGGGLIVILAAVLLMGSFARRLAHEIADLAVVAQDLADQQDPAIPKRLRGGPRPTAPVSSGGRPARSTAEIAEVTAAIGSLERAAASAAASEAALRDGLRQVFVSMARRNQSLLQRQLRLIDTLEQKASDPAALADLFSLDHLTTRMRRHAESLAILSGAAPGRAWREPVPIIDVVRGAMAEVEDYKRVTVLTRSEDSVAGAAVADMIHLLAELIENATLFSPSGTTVEVRASRVANGFAVEVDDRGLGIEPAQLEEINRQLANPPDFDLANSDRLGLFVGGKLAERHNVRVALRTSPYGGTTAIVLMPNSIVVAAAQPDGPYAANRPVGFDLRGTDDRDLDVLSPSDRGADVLSAAGRGLDSRRLDGSVPDSRTLEAAGSDRRNRLESRSLESRLEGRLEGLGLGSHSLDNRGLDNRSRVGRSLDSAGGSGQDAEAVPLMRRRTAPAQPAAGQRESVSAGSSMLPAPPALPAPSVLGRNAHRDVFQPAAGPGPAAPSITSSFQRPATAPPSPGGTGPGQRGGSAQAGQPGQVSRPGSAGRPDLTDDDTYHGLPRRTRQASLSPHLRDNPPSAPVRQPGADELSALAKAREPEAARDLAASLQSGWQRGRQAGTPEAPAEQPAIGGQSGASQPASDDVTAHGSQTAGDSEAAGRHDSDALPEREEK